MEEGFCSRCGEPVRVADTYDFEGRRWHRLARRKGVPCGPVFTRFEYRVVWQVEDYMFLPAPLTSQEHFQALADQIAARAGVPRVCILAHEALSRS